MAAGDRGCICAADQSSEILEEHFSLRRKMVSFLTNSEGIRNSGHEGEDLEIHHYVELYGGGKVYPLLT